MATGRRKFLKSTTALTALAATSAMFTKPFLSTGWSAGDPLLTKAAEKKETTLVIAGGSGTYLDAAKKLFYEPFSEATGIKIVPVTGRYGEKLTKLKAMNEVDNVEWDIVSGPVSLLVPSTQQYLFNLEDCSVLPNVAKHGVEGTCLGHGILFDVGGVPLVFDNQVFPESGPQPKNWADFWDVKAFPGPRALPNVGIPWWPLMVALEADGVPKEKLFPLDVKRAFRKLDEIKPHIGVWWKSGDQSQQILRDKEVVMSMMYSGRALKLQSESVPVSVVWDGAPLDAAFWAIVNKAPHPNAALAFFNFVMTRPKAHAEYARTLFYDTSNKDAISLLSKKEQRSRAVHPDNWSKLVEIDKGWVAKNRDQVAEDWAKWIAQ